MNLDFKINKSFSQELIADSISDNFVRQVNGAHFSVAFPESFSNSKLIHFSKKFAEQLGLEIKNQNDFLQLVSGQKPFNNFTPYSMNYGGHQFGHWAGQLGDGRAINIAETNLAGENWKFQLKGAGPTPYSRRADGYAVLRSSIREYLCSEAMYNLGIPTTRAISLVQSGKKVLRDVMYDGNPAYETGAIVCRVSPSFIRFGNFQIHAARGEIDLLKQLVDYTVKYHFNHLGKPSKGVYLAFFEEVCFKTIQMITHWQRVGFVHGVMNTDNMSILGLTIDYGPYGWLEDYDPSWTPNTTDAQERRYAFGNQPKIALWNLVQLANALYPLINAAEPFEKILEKTYDNFHLNYHNMMCAKLGLKGEEIPKRFITSLENLLNIAEIDMTIFYRKCSEENVLEEKNFMDIIAKSSYKEDLSKNHQEIKKWYNDYLMFLNGQKKTIEEVQQKMRAINPKYVLRNYMAQLAIEEAEKNNYDLIDELYKLLLNPYSAQPGMEKWFSKRPDWAINKIGCSMLSCSS